MTHCLDCGSERASDQCPVCGLTSAAAELVFRRRLIRQMTVFLAGSLLFPYVSQIYPPLDIVLESRARARKEIEVMRHLFTGLIPIPFILLTALVLNGRLDSPKNVKFHASVVDSRYQMKGVVRGTRRLFVPSWRAGHRVERLAVDSDDYDRFRPGDAVNVGVAPGALGIPWFYGVDRRADLDSFPEA